MVIVLEQHLKMIVVSVLKVTQDKKKIGHKIVMVTVLEMLQLITVMNVQAVIQV